MMSTIAQNPATSDAPHMRVLTSLSGALPGQISIHPLMGMVGVALGAMIATMNSRLLSVGLPDIRGAMGLGYDEASWIPTALNMATMFIGPFSVFLGGIFGWRKTLLFCAGILVPVSILLPFVPNLSVLLLLEVIAGLTSGSFYPLALSFILRNLPIRYAIFALALYAAGIDFSTNSAISLHAFYMQHLSWHWDFWTAALVTPFMMWLIYSGIPPSPPPPRKDFLSKWMGFLYASFGFALLYGALDQGERLYWWNSGTFVAMLSTGSFFLIVTVVRRLHMPNPFVDLPFLRQGDTLLMGGVLGLFRFVLLSTVVLIPQYLEVVRSHRPEQVSGTLLWVALPQLPLALLAALWLRRTDTRLPLALGFSLIAIACIMNSRLNSAWDSVDFIPSQIVMAVGQSMAFTGLLANIVMQALATNALGKPQWVLTFSAFFHTVRIFGGECGASFMTHFLSVREKIHSNLIGLHVDAGDWTVQQRLSTLAAGVFPNSNGADGASARAVGLLALQVRRQAYTQAVIDGFLLCAWGVIACLFVVLLLKRPPITYKDLDTVPGKPVAA
jgi:MFS transporter, DHA2 family, multidrug resistance protein